MLAEKLNKHIDLLIKRYPTLETIKQDIIDGYLIMEECYLNGGKLLVAGNGGSAVLICRINSVSVYVLVSIYS